METVVKNKKIIVVDDDPTISEMLKLMLELSGFVCFTANNVGVAIALILKVNPDLIISDIMMPETDGFQFRKKLLEMNELAQIPFVFLTSKNDEDYILKGYELGVENYIPKTTSSAVILKQIEQLFLTMEKLRSQSRTELKNAANKIKSELLPNEKSFREITVKEFSKPFEGVPGGDFIDHIKINKSETAMVIGDIMGKKWGAWFVSFAYISYIRSSIREVVEKTNSADPSEILVKINQAVLADSSLCSFFISLSIIIVDEQNKLLKYSGAGDLPILQLKKDGNILYHKTSGINLGIKEDGHYDSVTIQCSTKDTFFIYTDGITDIQFEGNELLGIEGLANIISKKNITDPRNIMNYIEKKLEPLIGDDITLVSIKFKSEKGV